jgi:hypothetical protein
MSFSPSGQSGRWGNRTLSNPVKGNWLAPSFLSQFGYLPFRKWSHRESNPDFQSAELVSSRWTMAPSVDRRGVEPRLPGCKPSVLPLNEQPIYFKRSVRESNPVPLLTTEVCCRNTYRPKGNDECRMMKDKLAPPAASEFIIQHSSLIILPVTEAGVEPAKSRGSGHRRAPCAAWSVVARRFACLRTRPWRVRVSLPAVQAHEARLGAGPTNASRRCPGPVGHLPSLQSSDEGESRTPMPISGTTV